MINTIEEFRPISHLTHDFNQNIFYEIPSRAAENLWCGKKFYQHFYLYNSFAVSHSVGSVHDDEVPDDGEYSDM